MSERYLSERYERFKAWLAAHPSEDKAGDTCAPGACPLANFLDEVTPFNLVLVYPDCLECWSDQGYMDKVPERWMKEFVLRVDELNGRMGGEVSYAQCLEIIDRMDKVMAH